MGAAGESRSRRSTADISHSAPAFSSEAAIKASGFSRRRFRVRSAETASVRDASTIK